MGAMSIRPGQDAWRQVAVIVAHPDDEILWCGGLILQNPDWDWTVLSLCRAGDADRRPKFDRVCEHLQVQGAICDLDDSCPPGPVDVARDIVGRIRRHVCGEDWDLCITHGANGEYGHERHRQVHAAVVRLVEAGELRCKELWTFAYVCDAGTGRCAARRSADVVVALTDGQLAEKKRIVHEMYGYGRDSFEVRACVGPEAFHRRATQ